jgi:FKBP-type peptidyl-prolyl cis-trans isomerase
MKSVVRFGLALWALGWAACPGSLAQEAPAADPPPAPLKLEEGFENPKDQGSYALGMRMGEFISQSFGGDDIDTDQVWRGFLDKFATGKVKLSPEQFEASLQALNQAMLDRRRAEGDAWLVENAEREGVKKTESGLQYEVLKEGDGPIPKLEDRVQVHYHGTLIDGSVFDSSVERGKPSEFSPRGVIPGWQEALVMMPKGSKWKIYVPANLAYGERPRGDKIKPNSPLIFELELLDILPPQAARKVEAVTPPVRIPPLKDRPGAKPEEKPANKPEAKPE